ncbi:MAG: type I restriction enzyme HsdR N-terminal domain-containing protein [Thermodesulfovibrionales bacterium]|nr:type I restriction enzyme HsdR N-terminal domain-containing protein [Thermodesulfovibrionales bacterium]
MTVFSNINDLANEDKIKQKVLSILLVQKGYLQEEILVDKEFEILVDGKFHKLTVDILIQLQNIIFMVVRCARGSLVTRQREVLSWARIIDKYQVPFSVVTNGQDAEIIDSANGEVIAYGLDSLPSKLEALESLKKIEFKRLSEERIEKEKRIFLAFDAFKCPSECH